MNIFLFLSLIFSVTFLVGRLLEKIRIPWIFAALLFGLVLSLNRPFADIVDSSIFVFLSNLGMCFLLFVIGLEIDWRQINKQKKFILLSTSVIIFFEAAIGTLVIHFLFDYSWFVAFIVALSFATVGEAILIPILDEFKAVNTSLGQLLIGIGTLDDVIEIFVLILLIITVGIGADGHASIALIILSLFWLLGMTFGFTKFRSRNERFKVLKMETLFVFVIAVLFLFIGIGQYAEAASLGSILAGIGLRTFLPPSRLQGIESEIKTMCYGFFAPIFFFWVGFSMDMKYLASAPFLILLIIIVSAGSKYLASYIIGRKKLGLKQSLILGTGLTVRFSTSIIVIKILLDNNIIKDDLYSVIIASSAIFTLVVPVLFSQLLKKYPITKNNL